MSSYSHGGRNEGGFPILTPLGVLGVPFLFLAYKLPSEGLCVSFLGLLYKVCSLSGSKQQKLVLIFRRAPSQKLMFW